METCWVQKAEGHQIKRSEMCCIHKTRHMGQVVNQELFAVQRTNSHIRIKANVLLKTRLLVVLQW